MIVVGARCAGAPTAMLLARMGHRVLLCDRARFPSDTVSNGAFNTPGPFYLRRWGLIDRLVKAGVPPVRSIRTHGFGGEPQVWPVPEDEATYAPMRRVLDDILARAAQEAGAEFRDGFKVGGLVAEDGRVAGIASADGAVEQARIVIGADGKRSTVARRAGARQYVRIEMGGGGVYSYYDGIPVDGYEFWFTPKWAMLAPANDGLTHVATSDFETTEGTPEERFERVLSVLPELRDRVHAGTRRTPLVAHRYSPVLHRQAYGPGWALVGDARFYQSDWNGYGMSHAFRDAERLATAVDEWLAGRADYSSALGGYERNVEDWSRPFLDTIVACMTALRDGRPQDAPWNGMAPAAQAWVERLRAGHP